LDCIAENKTNVNETVLLQILSRKMICSPSGLSFPIYFSPDMIAAD